MSEHIGRSWTEHPLEDACPCPQEPCGLIAVTRIDPACGQHALAAGKTIRQSHTPERCTMTAPTSPKPHTQANPNDLRTDLTKLADEMDPDDVLLANGFINKIRALLAAHPAEVVSDTRREDVIERVRATLGRTSESDEEVVDAVLAALPAPPVVDETEIADDIREAFNNQIDVGTWARRESFFVTTARQIAARLRGATRG